MRLRLVISNQRIGVFGVLLLQLSMDLDFEAILARFDQLDDRLTRSARHVLSVDLGNVVAGEQTGQVSDRVIVDSTDHAWTAANEREAVALVNSFGGIWDAVFFN